MIRRRWLQALAAFALAGPGGPATAQTRGKGPAGNVYDVVVVGSGLAGHCAALSARLSGAGRVLMLEKGALVGGHTAMASGSISFVDPERQSWQGIVDSVDQFVADARSIGGHIDEQLVRLIAGESARGIGWLEEQGVRFSPKIFRAFGGIHERCLTAFGNVGARHYIFVLYKRLRSLGVQTRLLAKAVGLRRLSDGMLALDVEDLRSAGRYGIRTHAVVLATGGFTANVALRMLYRPELTPDIPTTANPHGLLRDPATGDGLFLARELGAQWIAMDEVVLLSYWGGRMLDYIGGEIYVDGEGRRFVDETASTGAIAAAISRLPERSMFVITDAQSIKGVNVGSKLTTGSIHQSASVAEMAGDMGVPASVLQKELDEYNACARKGAPDRFGRTVYAQTIEKPPFYWGRERLMVHTTLGGLHVDAKARVLREDGSFIEGLYAAGEAAGGIWGADRPGGAGLLQCLVMGRIAGQSAAQQIKRLLQTGSG